MPDAKSTRLAFTKTELKKLRAPAEGRTFYYDTKTPALCLCITANDVRTWYVYRRIDGRPERVKLGRFPDLPVEGARKQAATVLGDIARGKNPQRAKRTARGESTLGELFRHWLDAHAKLHKKSWGEDQRQYDKFLKPWANRKLSAITRTDVQALHARIGRKNGHYAANRVLSLLCAMFNKAIDIGWQGTNPAARVKKFKEQSRDRFLQADELAPFFKALRGEPNETLRDFFEVALLTGARRENVQEMRWLDINLELSIWRIPDTKSGEPVLVPLAPRVVEILTDRSAVSAGSPWVFPSRSKTGHVVEPKAAWARIVKAAGLSNLRIHDLRRTLGSYQAATGASLQIIGKSLGHRNQATTAIYARLALDPVRESVGKATSVILDVASKEPGKKVGKAETASAS